MNVIQHDQMDFEAYFEENQSTEAAKVKPASDWVEAVIDGFYGETNESSWTPLGFDKIAGKFDLRPGEVTIWAGINSHGKTTLLSHVMLNVMRIGQKACLASLETPPARSMRKMTRQAAGAAKPTVEYIRAFHRWTDGRLWIYNHVGKVAAARMLAVATYVRKELGIEHMVIDSLMKCGMGTDDYNAQKDFIDSLCTIAKDTGLHIHLVAHMKKGESEHKAPDKFDVSGGGDLTNMVDNLVIVHKNQRKHARVEIAEKEKDETARNAQLAQLRLEPDAFVRVAKQRDTGWEGSLAFWFDRPSEQFLEAPYSHPTWIDTGEDLGAQQPQPEAPLFDFPDEQPWEVA